MGRARSGSWPRASDANAAASAWAPLPPERVARRRRSATERPATVSSRRHRTTSRAPPRRTRFVAPRAGGRPSVNAAAAWGSPAAPPTTDACACSGTPRARANARAKSAARARTGAAAEAHRPRAGQENTPCLAAHSLPSPVRCRRWRSRAARLNERAHQDPARHRALRSRRHSLGVLDGGDGSTYVMSRTVSVAGVLSNVSPSSTSS